MKRALLIGSQTLGLTGVHGDIELMDDALTGIGFTTIPSIGAGATTDEIFERYRGLIQDTGPDDTAVVYYSGHGGRIRNPVAGGPRWLQFIVPTDCEDRSDDRAHCVLAEELSQLQRELTQKTKNVTVILDCCHSARMSRRGLAIPKAFDQLNFPEDDLLARWRAATRSSNDGNPDAVRVVACSPDQSAFEDYSPVFGARHGVLTAALVPLIKASEGITWLDALEIMRKSVVTDQRPDMEGPADRLLFSLRTRSAAGVLPVRVKGMTAMIPDAALFGVTPGDRYTLMAPDAEEFGDALVLRVNNGNAILKCDADVERLPVGTTAWPADVALTRRPVALLPLDAPRREELAAQFQGTAGVEPVDRSESAIATARIDNDRVTLLDVAGEPLVAQPLPFDRAVDAVRTLAVADHVRNLPNGRLPADVTITYVRLLPDDSEVEVTSGEHLFLDDRLIVRVKNTSGRKRYFATFDIGLAGAVTQLSTSEPSGVTLLPDETYELGRDWDEGGMPLLWPDNLPTGAPRLETFVTIVADRQVDRLAGLGQSGLRRFSPATTDLDRMIDSLSDGRRDVPRPGAGAGVQWRVDRFDFLLHPSLRPTQGEPEFEIDERTDASFRLLMLRGVDAPGRVAVRLKELTVHNNRSLRKARVRVDAVVITPAPAEAGGPYQASTMRFDRIGDGDRLPLDDVLIYEGPVARFLDIALWVSKDNSPDTELADLLRAKAEDEKVSGAIVTLAALAVAAPAAAAIAGSVAAVSILVSAAASVLNALQGNSIGVYRTTLLPHQRFGVAEGGIGRHPAQGLLRAQDISFAFEVIES